MQLTMTERFLDEVFNDFMALRQEWTDQGADNKYTSSRRAGARPRAGEAPGDGGRCRYWRAGHSLAAGQLPGPGRPANGVRDG